MKKILVSALSVAVLSCLAGMTTGWAQGAAGRPANAKAQTAPHRIALIDMAHIFKKYKKFEALREDLKAEIGRSDGEAKKLAEQFKTIQAEMKRLKEGSPDYQSREKQLLQISSDMEAFRKGAQMKFLRRESEIYKTVYLEVSDAVKQYCEYYEITLVIRFNREPLETASSPQDVLSRLNKQVVFNRPEDDITTAVLDYLNRQYEKSAGGAANPVRTTGAER